LTEPITFDFVVWFPAHNPPVETIILFTFPNHRRASPHPETVV